MFLEIVSPEATLFSQKVAAVSVPGINGEFQLLNNHASIVSVLGKGNIRIQGKTIEIQEAFQSHFSNENGQYVLAIDSGTIEMKDNKVIVLVD